MPWCPKCKYEYRREITQCPDCDEALAETDPNPPESNAKLVGTLFLTAVYIVAPWLWYFSVALLVNMTHPRPQNTMTFWDAIAVTVSSLAVAVGAFLLGFRRRIHCSPLPYIMAIVIGGPLQLGISISLTLLGLNENGAAAIAFPFWTAPISVVALLLVWLGGKVHGMRARKPRSEE